MTWFAIIALAVVIFAFAAFALRVGRGGWTLLGATLLFGLTGYAVQGSPEQPATPGTAQVKEAVDGELLVTARREFFDETRLPSRWVVTGDGFVRRGDYESASGLYRNAAQENPRDAEAWLAMAIALVEHAEGTLSPAALEAFERAQTLDDTNGAPRYFLGLAWLRAGEPARTRELWIEALRSAPENAPWRESLALRIMQLDALMTPQPPANASE